jgi:hypothetical protein
MEHLKEKTTAAHVVVHLKDTILISNNLIEIPEGKVKTISKQNVATIFANLAYFGYVLSKESVKRLLTLKEADLQRWWLSVEPTIREITGDSRKMGDHVVYKNFPQEVMDMSESEYWFNQILMYLGMPNEWVTTEAKPRDLRFKKDSLKVLHPANDNSLVTILNTLLTFSVRWNPSQLEQVKFLYDIVRPLLTATSIPFKENLVAVIEYLMDKGEKIHLKSATDVLRVAIVMSGGNLKEPTKVKFKKLSKTVRKYFLTLLEGSTSLEDDVTRDTERWKRFLYALHPGDYAKRFPKVVKVYGLLYNNKAKSFNGKLDSLIKKNDIQALKVAAARPGEFMRKLKVLTLAFPEQITNTFVAVSERMTVFQLLKLKKYLETTNERSFRMFAPKGNWTKVQVVDNNTSKVNQDIIVSLLEIIEGRVKEKVETKLEGPVRLDERVKGIKLSASDVAAYGRGTEFLIPEGVTFIRTASYWENKTHGNNWFDNGWNFFDDNWNEVGHCTWDESQFGKDALFSGDPTNSKTSDGKACQLIDIYLNNLAQRGVRYGVWSVMCYSGIKFKDATDVFAALQWGDDANKGRLFEPSRAQISFPLKDNTLYKFIAYVDIQERKLVFMDANFKADKSSTSRNGKVLTQKMPAYLEYLATIPSVYDLFEPVRKGGSGKRLHVVYDDKDVSLKDDRKAYVFKPLNEENKFTQLNLNDFL